MQKNIHLLIGIGLFSWSCQSDDLAEPSFGVTTEKTTYQVGEAVSFQFSGNPDFITFYSGEHGKNYAYANLSDVPGTPTLQFTSARSNGENGLLQLMVSDNFAGVVAADEPTTQNNISNATWQPITDRANWSSGANTNSGEIDLSDFSAAGKPVYLAFKYSAESEAIQNRWTITALTVTNNLPDGRVYTIANLTSAAIANYGISTIFSPGWVAYKMHNDYNWTLSTSSLLMAGATTAEEATAPAEAWSITGPLNLDKVAPDIGTPIKGMDTRQSTYSDICNTPGTYRASFVGSSNNVYGENSVVKQIDVTIKE